MPETNISGFLSITTLTANFTESAGVPSMANPERPHDKLISSDCNGLEIVIACPTPLFSDFGATTVVSPISDIASQRAFIPSEKILSSFTINIEGGGIRIKNQSDLIFYFSFQLEALYDQ